MNKSFAILVLTLILPVSLTGYTCSPENATGLYDNGLYRKDIDGIDVSRHQCKNGKIDWVKVSKALPKDAFVYVKCTEGSTYRDPKYKENANGAKKQGLSVGGYHYFRMTSGAHEQFRNFKKALDMIDADLIPMVDVETNDGRPVKQLQDSLQVFLNLLEKEYGKKPMIYGTNRSYNTYCAPKFNGYHLYLGRYGSQPPVIKGKGHYSIWQYSDKAKINGIRTAVDVCRFHPEFNIGEIRLDRKE